MKRRALGLLVILASEGVWSSANAQTETTTPPPAANPAGPPPIKIDEPAVPAATVDRKAVPTDVVVVPRKDVLKSGRLELAPFSGISLNDNLVRHYAFGGDLNYFLTDVLWIGLQGQYFIKELTERDSLVGLQYNRSPAVNRYNFSGAFNFGYVPGYGKFTIFNKYIFHWDLWVTAGVGVIQTQIIPTRPQDETFKNLLISPNAGAGWRFFLSRWLTFNVSVRDYIFNDKYESLTRPPGQSGEAAKANATSGFVNNIMLYAGVSLYLPTSFQYRTPR